MPADRIKVLHVGKYYPPDKGGIETVIHLLCRELRPHVDVSVVVAGRSASSIEEEREGIIVRRAGSIFRIANMSVCPAMPALIRRAKPDLIHLHHPNPVGALSVLLSGFSGPLVVTYHSDLMRLHGLTRFFEPFVHYYLRRSAKVLATSQAYIDSSHILSHHRDKCAVVPLGIYAEEYKKPFAEETAGVRAKYGSRIVLSVCRLRYYKGLSYLVEAMKQVDAVLLIVGDGAERRNLERQIAGLGLAHRVHLLGWVENLVPYYQACDVFALPSINRTEAFGLVQLEAMACAKPVVNTSIPSGVSFACPPGLCGLSVPPCSSEELARALNTLIDDGALRLRLGTAGRERVHQLFTVPRMVERVLRIYEEALSCCRTRTGSNVKA